MFRSKHLVLDTFLTEVVFNTTTIAVRTLDHRNCGLIVFTHSRRIILDKVKFTKKLANPNIFLTSVVSTNILRFSRGLRRNRLFLSNRKETTLTASEM